MPRTKDFDVDEAVRAARDVFWRRGFEATSVADLVAATGVGRQSLYDTFGDKAALYRRALAAYCEEQHAVTAARLDGDGPVLPRVRALVQSVVESALTDRERRGCFVVSAGSEAPACGAAPVPAQLDRLQDLLARALSAAQAGGELGPAADPRALARSLVVTLTGVQALARAHPDPGLLRDAARLALEPLS